MLTLNSFLQEYQKVPIREYPNRTHLKNSLVTVCIFTFNQEETIGRCLDGILMQKTNFDYIIYIGEDDSKKDNTRAICIEYAEKYPDKIKLILHKEENKMLLNNRLSARFNMFYGLLFSQSKYIATCDGDDYWTDPLKLQKQVDFLVSNPLYGLCYTNFKSQGLRTPFAGKNNILYSFFVKLHSLFINPNKNRYSAEATGSYSFDFVDSVNRINGLPLTLLFERELLNMDYFFHSIQQFTSADWAIECLITHKKKGFKLNDITAIYNIHDNSISAKKLSNPIIKNNEHLIFFKFLLKKHPDLLLLQKKVIRKKIQRIYFQRSLAHFAQNSFFNSLNDLLMAIKMFL